MAEQIKVLMVGGRRAGKTSILASVAKCARAMAGQGRVKFDASENSDLTYKAQELGDYMKMYEVGETIEPDHTPSSVDKTYTFRLHVNGRNTGFEVVFIDIPGEWMKLTESEENKAKVNKYISESHVVIIAIDTPHLMEKVDNRLGYGVYHSEYNRVNEIVRYFKDGLQQDGSNSRLEDRLVLFVPIKCEKYYWQTVDHNEDRMERVNSLVHAGYKELFDHLATPALRQRVSVAIVPVITIGGMEFYRFKDDSYVGNYVFVADETKQEYEPLYCEQPLLRILDYVLTQAVIVRQRRGPLAALFDRIIGRPGLAALTSCHQQIRSQIINDSKLGFETVQ